LDEAKDVSADFDNGKAFDTKEVGLDASKYDLEVGREVKEWGSNMEVDEESEKGVDLNSLGTKDLLLSSCAAVAADKGLSGEFVNENAEEVPVSGRGFGGEVCDDSTEGETK
jgi:hypothetical protein